MLMTSRTTTEEEPCLDEEALGGRPSSTIVGIAETPLWRLPWGGQRALDAALHAHHARGVAMPTGPTHCEPWFKV